MDHIGDSAQEANNPPKVQLEVQEQDGTWRDAGVVHLLDKLSDTSVSDSRPAGDSGRKCVVATANSAAENKPTTARLQLPVSVKTFIRKHHAATVPRKKVYLYRHAPTTATPTTAGNNTNILLLFHGAGGTHSSFDALARQMALPETCTLAIQAHQIVLPFGLGTTWCQEMDYSTGLVLPIGNKRRTDSRQAASWWLTQLLQTLGWIPERVFLLGYGAGAGMVLETVSSLWKGPPLGGAICIVGGSLLVPGTPVNTKDRVETNISTSTTAKKTPLLILVAGDKSSSGESYSAAAQAAKAYCGDSNVHIQKPAKSSISMEGMIDNPQDMRVVMEFLAPKLVRQSHIHSSCD